MYILTNSNKVVISIGTTLEEQEDRYIIDNIGVFKEYKTEDANGNITTDTISSFEVSEVPEDLEPQKYCYTKKKGFYKNPDYVEHFSEEERISALEDAVNELILGGM